MQKIKVSDKTHTMAHKNTQLHRKEGPLQSIYEPGRHPKPLLASPPPCHPRYLRGCGHPSLHRQRQPLSTTRHLLPTLPPRRNRMERKKRRGEKQAAHCLLVPNCCSQRKTHSPPHFPMPPPCRFIVCMGLGCPQSAAIDTHTYVWEVLLCVCVFFCCALSMNHVCWVCVQRDVKAWCAHIHALDIHFVLRVHIGTYTHTSVHTLTHRYIHSHIGTYTHTSVHTLQSQEEEGATWRLNETAGGSSNVDPDDSGPVVTSDGTWVTGCVSVC